MARNGSPGPNSESPSNEHEAANYAWGNTRLVLFLYVHYIEQVSSGSDTPDLYFEGFELNVSRNTGHSESEFVGYLSSRRERLGGLKFDYFHFFPTASVV
jgi:hypothetical protein